MIWWKTQKWWDWTALSCQGPYTVPNYDLFGHHHHSKPFKAGFPRFSNSVWTNLLRNRVWSFNVSFVHGGFEVNGICGLKASLHWKSILLWGILQFFVIAGQIALRPKRCICLSTLKMASKETQQTTDPLFYPLQWSPCDAVTSTVFKCLLWRRTWTFEPELRSAIPSGATGLFEGFVQYKSSLDA